MKKRILVIVAVTALLAPPAIAQNVRPEDVRRAMDAAVNWLKRERQHDGTWRYLDERFSVGADSLIVLALLHSGIAPDDGLIGGAIARIAKSTDDYTYNVALKLAVLAAADPVKHKKAIQDSANYLSRTQLRNGMWTYAGKDVRLTMGRGDHSNTQFALYGLNEAARAGARIERTVWQNASQHWVSTQCNDGGWAYTDTQHQGYGSMTAAGVASLIICGESTGRTMEQAYKDGSADRCGRYATSRPLAAGLDWLAKNYDVRRNPNHHSYHFYWLYGVERAGMLSGLKYFGPHDWYREGAAYLVARQAGNGSWNGSVIDTAFGLLFLAKGRRPVIMNKLKWSDDNQWNLDRHDCENLVAFLGDKLGERVSWQIVPKNAEVEEWLDAPILYFNGHRFPEFRDADVVKLQRFVEGGGLLYIEACCSKAAFVEGFEKFARRAFPDSPLRDLDASHPVWNAMFALKPGRFSLKGIDVGCRTSIIFAPVDLSCLWEQVEHELSEEAYQIGANIAAYATGREPLRDKLAVVRLPEKREPGESAVPPTAALRFAHLAHTGDWRPDPHALEHLAELLTEKAGVDVVTQAVPLRPDDTRLRAHPISYLTGHHAFEMKDGEIQALRDYLDRGGFLFADACCGRDKFDASFRTLTTKLYPESALKRIPGDHAIIAGKPGYDLSRVSYRPTLAAEQPNLKQVMLEGIEHEGRLVVVYSKYGFTCGLEDHQCYSCRGLAPDDARRLAVNIVLYALSR